MALIVEDGTGLTNSNSYASAADADAYHAERNNTAWFADVDRDAMLIRATQFIESNYRNRWPGVRLKYRPDANIALMSRQALSWPRFGAVDVDGYPLLPNALPIELVRATCEAALRELVIQQQQAAQQQQASSGTTVASSDQLLKRKSAGDTTFEYYNVPTTATATTTTTSSNSYTATPATTYGVADIIGEILSPILLSVNQNVFGATERFS